MIDKNDNIVHKVELGSNVGVSGARTYFVKSKRLDGKEFDKLWRVMEENEYNKQFNIKKSSNRIEWWKEEKHIADEALKW